MKTILLLILFFPFNILAQNKLYEYYFPNNSEVPGPKEYYNNGKLFSETKFDSVNNTKTLFQYHKNGKLHTKINFKNEKLDGEQLELDQFGDTLYYELFRQDTLITYIERSYSIMGNLKHLKTFFQNIDSLTYTDLIFTEKGGKLFSHPEETINNLKGSGNHIYYFKNGNISSKDSLVNNKIQGESFGYYNNGKIQYKCNYLNDELHGELIYYNLNGDIKKKILYKNGKKISVKKKGF